MFAVVAAAAALAIPGTSGTGPFSPDATIGAALTWPVSCATPLVTIVPPEEAAELNANLREAASRHSDVAWVRLAPDSTKDGLPVLGQELLDASGVVGLRRPRAAGERHLLRVMSYWIHGDVRHVIVDDAQYVPIPVLQELHSACLIAGIQLWLMVDAPSRTDHVEWATAMCARLTVGSLHATWKGRPEPPRLCPVRPARTWWINGGRWPITQRPCSVHRQRIDCLLAAARRQLTAGDIAPKHVRTTLSRIFEQLDSTVDDWWAVTAASRDLLTPGLDALTHLAVDGTSARLGDLNWAGEWVNPDRDLHVPAPKRGALARLRTSRVMAGCLPEEAVLGIFDQESPWG